MLKDKGFKINPTTEPGFKNILNTNVRFQTLRISEKSVHVFSSDFILLDFIQRNRVNMSPIKRQWLYIGPILPPSDRGENTKPKPVTMIIYWMWLIILNSDPAHEDCRELADDTWSLTLDKINPLISNPQRPRFPIEWTQAGSDVDLHVGFLRCAGQAETVPVSIRGGKCCLCF